MIDMQKILTEELEYWDGERKVAIEQFNTASVALSVLARLTEQMRIAVEHEHQTNTFEGVEREAKTV